MFKALITGASQGIGKAVKELFHKNSLDDKLKTRIYERGLAVK